MLVAALLLVGCGDYTISLMDGYRLMRVSGGGRFVLVEPEEKGSRILAGPSVTAYHETRHLLVGRVEALDEERDTGAPGFFIVDKRTGDVEKGLERNEWEARLQQVDLQPVPALTRPSRLRAWF